MEGTTSGSRFRGKLPNGRLKEVLGALRGDIEVLGFTGFRVFWVLGLGFEFSLGFTGKRVQWMWSVFGVLLSGWRRWSMLAVLLDLLEV